MFVLSLFLVFKQQFIKHTQMGNIKEIILKIEHATFLMT